MSGDAKEEMNTDERIKNVEARLNKAQTNAAKTRLGRDENEAQTRLARLIAGFKSIQHQLVQRLERLEELTATQSATVADALLPQNAHIAVH